MQTISSSLQNLNDLIKRSHMSKTKRLENVTKAISKKLSAMTHFVQGVVKINFLRNPIFSPSYLPSVVQRHTRTAQSLVPVVEVFSELWARPSDEKSHLQHRRVRGYATKTNDGISPVLVASLLSR